MSTEQHTAPVTEQPPPSWGAAPPPAGRRWSGRKTAAVLGVAAAIAAAGGVTIYATSGSGTTSTTAQGPGGAGGAPGGGAGGASAALHGTYTVADDSGTGFHTELTQTGKVTAVSATSITMISDDNYTKTYTIDAGTVVQAMSAGGPGSSAGTLTTSSIAAGDQVTVTAAVAGSTVTVDTVMEQA